MKKYFGIVLCLFLASALFAAGSEETAQSTSGPSGTITLYTSVPQPIADKIQADFNANYPDITLEIFRSGTSGVVTKLMTEKEAGQIMADLVWVAEPSTYEEFKDQNMLAKIDPNGARDLPEEMKDPEGYYYAGRLINMIIGYNPNLVSRPPETWQDLLASEYRGKIGMPSPLRSGAAVATAHTLAEAYGWEYFERFKANGGVQAANNGTVRDAIASGEYKAGIFLDYMAREAKQAGSPLDYVWPSDGAVFIPSPIAVLEASSNKEAAIVFVDYILSKEGQKTMVKLGNFIPVRGDVEPPADAPSLDEIKRMKTDWKSVQADLEATNTRWTSLFGAQ